MICRGDLVPLKMPSMRRRDNSQREVSMRWTAQVAGLAIAALMGCSSGNEPDDNGGNGDGNGNGNGDPPDAAVGVDLVRVSLHQSRGDGDGGVGCGGGPALNAAAFGYVRRPSRVHAPPPAAAM